MNFLRNLLATLVGLFIFTFLCFLLLIGIVSIASSEEEVTLSDASVLHLQINGPIIERKSEDPFEAFNEVLGGGPTAVGLKELKEAIKNAKTDDKVEGIYLEPQFLTSGFAKLEELREALLDFRSEGKFVIAYSEAYSEADYFLASVADEIYLNPLGMLEFNGLSAEVTFFKGTLDKIGVEPQIFKVGDFKSAVEPFTRTDMSEASRLQTESFVNSIYDVYLEKVAESRKIDLNELRETSSSMLVQNAAEALQYKLVTTVGYRDEVYDNIRERLDIEEDKDIDFVTHGKYLKTVKNTKVSDNRIAVIIANGNIVSGKGTDTSIGSDTFAEEIRKVRKDDKVKAVVLRINSPGGSALASDVIWREVKLTQAVKPIIASMSDVAASGGYYIAMACDTIVANPTTITGSIGVFGMLPNAEELLENKLGITTDVVKTGKYSDILTISRPLSEFEMQVFQKGVEETYETFTNKAAEGRGMTIEELKAVASGRVWSGTEAKANGLVDVFGGLETAIEVAADHAGIADDYKINYYPKQKNFVEQLVSELGGEMEATFMKKDYGELTPYVQKLKQLQELSGIQARMPFDYMIK